MKARSAGKMGVLAAAVAAALVGGAAGARADTLIWDANGAAAPLGADGGGSWDLSSLNWVSGDTTTGTNVAWTNGSSAQFGNLTSSFASPFVNNNVSVGSAIVVQDITLGTGADGSVYNIDDFNGGTLTLNGNINKATGGGVLNITMGLSNNLALGAGDHVIALRDTPGDLPELTINNAISGTGNLVLDNGSQGYESWGSMVLNTDSSFNGSTTITKGRLVVTSNNALSSNSTGVFIGDDGALSVGGASTVVNGVTLNQPITISRSDYGSDADHSHYQYALAFNNGSGTSTVSGPVTINSTDARISVNTSTVTFTQPFVEGSGVAAGSSVVTFTGDFAGYVKLTADNSAYKGSFQLLNAVEVQPANQNAIGGPNSKISFTGGATLQPPADMPSFGTHVINYDSFNGGIDVAPGQTFTVDHAITGGSGLGQRGAGTLNINAPITGTGQTFWDGVTAGGPVGGIVNVNAAVTVGSLHLRSPVVNINDGGSITTTGGYNSFGQDTAGSNGSADNAVVNIRGNGSLTENTADDFNISDNPGTSGTINLYDNATFTTNGITWLAKANGATGTINQSGGAMTIKRSGNFGFVIADGRGGKSPTGHYNLSGGTFTSAGEVYVGEGGAGATGYWTQSGGTANVNNWFVIGREGAVGHVDISGGTLNHSGGNMSLGDSNNGGVTDTIKVHGNAVINDNGGELWVGNNPGAVAQMDVSDTASVTANTWLAVGRGGGTGTLNVSGGAVTQQTSNWFTIGSNGTGTVNVSGGVVNALQMYVGEVGGGSGTLTVSGGAVNAGPTIVGNAGAVTGTINLQAGAFTATSITAGGSSGTKAVNFTGGQLTVGSYAMGADLANTGTGTLAPGGAGAVGSTAITGGGYQQGANAALGIDIAGASSYDAVTAAGDSVINGLVSVDVLGSYVPAPGSFFDVFVSGASLTGAPTLGGPDGSMFTESIVNGNTLRLTVPGGAVPEPGSLAVLGVIGAGMFGARRRRRA